MVRVFYTQKTEQLIEKLELIQWKNHLQKKINHSFQELSENTKMDVFGERIKIKNCPPYDKFIF